MNQALYAHMNNKRKGKKLYMGLQLRVCLRRKSSAFELQNNIGAIKIMGVGHNSMYL
jgi:hypothetical protein